MLEKILKLLIVLSLIIAIYLLNYNIIELNRKLNAIQLKIEFINRNEYIVQYKM